MKLEYPYAVSGAFMRRLLLSRLALLLVLLGCTSLLAESPVPETHIRIHYHRADAAYTGWTVFAFGNTTEDQGNFNAGPVQISGTDTFGVYFDVDVTPHQPRRNRKRSIRNPPETSASRSGLRLCSK